MASSSGNSSGSSQLQNSGSEADMQVLMDERKRKRMQSNRESARRSRMRKQKHLDDLMSQVSHLRKDNHQILTSINITTQHFLSVEAENSILRAQMIELSQRLDSLTDMLNYINTAAAAAAAATTITNGIFPTYLQDDSLMNPLNSIYLNQPIMASPDLFNY